MKRQKYDKKCEIDEPKEFVLGVRMDRRGDRPVVLYSQIPVTEKYMSVPI